MPKKSFVSVFCLIPLVILLCLLTGCNCKHEWQAATCTAAKTCSLCQVTEGEALGHAWADASCEAPKTCSVCKATEGEALGHSWVDATTETPKTCSTCEKTEGDRIITDNRFKTANCKDLFGTWIGIVEVPGSTIVEQGFSGVLKMEFSIVFNHDGTFEESTKLLEGEQFNQSVEDYYADILFKEFTTQGYTQAQADQAMITAYGMNVKDYAKKLASAFNWENLVNTSRKGVYYVEDEKLHSGTGWNATLESDTYTIANSTLTIDSLVKQYPGTILTKS